MAKRQKGVPGGEGQPAEPTDPTCQINVRIPESLRDWIDDECASWIGSGWKPTKEGRRQWTQADVVIRALELLRARKKIEDRLPKERTPRRKS